MEPLLADEKSGERVHVRVSDRVRWGDNGGHNVVPFLDWSANRFEPGCLPGGRRIAVAQYKHPRSADSHGTRPGTEEGPVREQRRDNR